MKASHSRLTLWQTCPRQYMYTYVDNIVTRRDAVPLIVGDAVHRGLAAYYSGSDQVKEQASAAFTEVRAKNEWLEPELDDLKKQEDYVYLILDEYAKWWGTEEWTVLAPEIEGHIKLGKHLFFFRADLLVSWRGHPWLVEHKTTAQIGEMFFKSFKNDGQMSAYNYCTWKKLKMRPVGAVLNVIRKSKKLDTADFQRDVIMRSEEQVARYMHEVEVQLDELEERLKEPTKDNFPMHTKECVRFNRTCDYTELCMDDKPDFRGLFQPREPNYVDEGGNDEG